MKRILKISIVLCIIVLSALLITSCGGEKMRAPGGLRIDADTQMVKWNKIVGAYSYDVAVGDDENYTNTKGNSFSLEYLEPGEYEIRVRAISSDKEILPSDWSTVKFTREAETGLKYKLINNRTEYELIGAGSATGDVVMESTYRGKPVTSIAKKAFTNNKKITSLVIGSNVKTIGDSAFSKAAALTEITIPASVTSIGEYAFQSCKALTKVNFEASCDEIKPYTFSWCSELESITLGDTVKKIGEYAFSNCTKLSSMNVGKVEFIGEYAFSDCSALKTVTLPAIKEIDAYAFYNCVEAETLTFGEPLISIGDAAFTNCAKITEITLPEGAESIGVQSFANCTALASVTVGNSITSIGSGAFLGTKFYDEGGDTVYVGGWLIAHKDKSITKLPKLKEGTYGIGASAFSECNKLTIFNLSDYGIKYVGDGAFYGCKQLYDIKFGNSLLKIGDYAFASCDVLRDVYLGESLTHIGDYAFSGCAPLSNSKVKLPDSLVSIGTYAFHGTSAYNNEATTGVVYIDDWVVGLKQGMYQGLTIAEGTRGIANYSFYNSFVFGAIILPNSVEYIGRSAFYNCTYTSMINLPTSLKSIGDYAFYGCTMTTFGPFVSETDPTTVIPNGTTYIGRSAFYDCSTLAGIAIPGSVKEIGDYAFYKCINLGEGQLVSAADPTKLLVGSVIIGEGVEKIGERAFFGCESIAEIAIPDSVKTIGEKSFYKCTKLRKLTIGNGVEVIPAYAFYKCTALAELTLPTSLKTIGTYAFRGCEALVTVTIPEGVTSVGAHAFSGASSALILELPATLTEIGEYAFRGFGKLKSVVIPASVEIIGKHAFYGCSELTIYTEAQSIMPKWSERFNSSYRPIVFGCTLSDDKSYVVSFTMNKDAIDNTISENGALTCYREGFEFIGWAENAESAEAAYTPTEAMNAEDGKVLFTIWKAITNDD